jgi:hypothetical protein
VRGKLIVPETNAYESKPIVIAEARLLKAFSI